VRLLARLRTPSGATLARRTKRVEARGPRTAVTMRLALGADSLNRLHHSRRGALLTLVAKELTQGGRWRRAADEIWVQR
jgi:hypothetical protein